LRLRNAGQPERVAAAVEVSDAQPFAFFFSAFLSCFSLVVSLVLLFAFGFWSPLPMTISLCPLLG
jgi:hypothetical protein